MGLPTARVPLWHFQHHYVGGFEAPEASSMVGEMAASLHVAVLWLQVGKMWGKSKYIEKTKRTHNVMAHWWCPGSVINGGWDGGIIAHCNPVATRWKKVSRVEKTLKRQKGTYGVRVRWHVWCLCCAVNSRWDGWVISYRNPVATSWKNVREVKKHWKNKKGLTA